MGNTSFQTQQQQWIQYHQLLQIPGTPTLLCSSYDSSLYAQKYILSTQITQQQIKTYQIRRNPIDNIVNLYDFSLKNDLSKCVSMCSSMVVITQRIPYRLSMLKGISREQGLFILKNAANGYKHIYKVNKACYSNDKMIGILNNGNPKVWISQIWAKNSPDIPCNRQDKMVDQLINVVQQYIRKQQTTGFGNLFHQQLSKRQKTFVQLDKVINFFIGQNISFFNQIAKNRLKIRIKQIAVVKTGSLMKNNLQQSQFAGKMMRQSDNVHYYVNNRSVFRDQQFNLILGNKKKVSLNNQIFEQKYTPYNYSANRPATDRLNKRGRFDFNQAQNISSNHKKQDFLFENQFEREKPSKSLPNQNIFRNSQQIKQEHQNLSNSNNKRVSNIDYLNANSFYPKRNSYETVKNNLINPDSTTNSNTSLTFGSKHLGYQEDPSLKYKNTQNNVNLITSVENNKLCKKVDSMYIKDHIDFETNNKIEESINQKLKINFNGHQYQRYPPSKIHQIRTSVISSYNIKQNEQSNMITKNKNQFIQEQQHTEQKNISYPITPIYKVNNFLPNDQIRKNGESQTINKNLAYRDLQFQDKLLINGSGCASKYYMKDIQPQTNLQKNISYYQYNQKKQQKLPLRVQNRKINLGQDQKMNNTNTSTKRTGQQEFQQQLCLTPSSRSQQSPQTQKFANMFKYYLQSYQSQNQKQNKQQEKHGIEEQDLFNLMRQDNCKDQPCNKINKFQLHVIQQGSQMDY